MIMNNTNGGSFESVKLDYATPKLVVVSVKTTHSVLVYSNEHTEEEDLF